MLRKEERKKKKTPQALILLFNEIHEALNYVIGEGSQIKGRKISPSGGMSDGTGVVACTGGGETLRKLLVTHMSHSSSCLGV